jgi:hypothetical protein
MTPNNFVVRNVDTVAPSIIPPAYPRASELPADQSQVIGPTPAHPRKKSRLAFIWGISGTVLSALGFVVLTFYQQYNDSLNELRRDLNHFHEASGELVKKESLRKCREKLIECLKELRDSAAMRAQVERDLQTSQEERKEMIRELQRVRERLASVEGRQSAISIVVPQTQHDNPGSHSTTRKGETANGAAAPSNLTFGEQPGTLIRAGHVEPEKERK